MRDVMIVIVILALVFGGDILIENYLENSSNDLLLAIEEMSGDFYMESDRKKQKVENLLQTWEEKEKPWIVFEYHDAINEIEDLVIETYSYFLDSNKEEFDIAYRKLMRLIDDFRNRADLSLENVL